MHQDQKPKLNQRLKLNYSQGLPKQIAIINFGLGKYFAKSVGELEMVGFLIFLS